jgi:alanyl-tRNA synthetase
MRPRFHIEMTDRLYYREPYRRSFDATVRAVYQRPGRVAVVLDRTAFYPTSGGQPFDTGVLGGCPVVEVVEVEEGVEVAEGVERLQDAAHDTAVIHVLAPDAGAPSVGDEVHGEIDWPRRFDHMQQHTGQHVLSAAFDRLFGARTVSFHLGSEAATIDLAREMTDVEIASAESEANRIVWEDRPVAVRFASKEEAARMPLRKEPVRQGTLRLIDIEGWDLSACGGTHVATTGGIGLIAVASRERFKGGQRLEFLCGGRVLTRFRSNRDSLAASVRLLSVLPNELPASIERLQADAKEQKRLSVSLQADLARYRAAELSAEAENTAVGKLVLRSLDLDAGSLKALAVAIARAPGFFIVLVSSSTPALAVVARSADGHRSAQEVVSSLVARFGGRGGGKPELAQGGGLSAPPATILEFTRALLVS